MSTRDPYRAPSPDQPTPLAPNRRSPLGLLRRILLIYAALMGVLLLVRLATDDSPLVDLQRGNLWQLIPPAVAYGLMLIALVVLRARLPESYKNWALRTEPMPGPPVPSEALTPVHLVLQGTSGGQRATLTVADEGLRWEVSAGRLGVAQELSLSWEDLKSMTTAVRRPWAQFGLSWFLIWLGSGALLQDRSPLGAVLVVAGMAIGFVRGPWKGRRVTVVSRQHVVHLDLTLAPETEQTLLRAVQARRGQGTAARARFDPKQVLMLFVGPWQGLARATWRDADLYAYYATLIPPGRPVPEPTGEQGRAAVIQLRIMGVWNGVVLGVAPVSAAVGANSWVDAWVGLSVSLGLGWVLSVLLAGTFGRFAGLTVHE